MKKIMVTFVLSLILSIPVFAEGETHNGGRSCPPEQTCYTEGSSNAKKESPSVTQTSKTAVSNFPWTDFRNFYLFLKSIL